MTDLERALAEIGHIRSQLAKGDRFHGLGPTAFTATGVLAILAAGLQWRWMAAPAAHFPAFLVHDVNIAHLPAFRVNAAKLVNRLFYGDVLVEGGHLRRHDSAGSVRGILLKEGREERHRCAIEDT